MTPRQDPKNVPAFISSKLDPKLPVLAPTTISEDPKNIPASISLKLDPKLLVLAPTTISVDPKRNIPAVFNSTRP